MTSKVSSAEKRITDLGINVPPVPQPLGAYTETVQSGRRLFVTGMIPPKSPVRFQSIPFMPQYALICDGVRIG